MRTLPLLLASLASTSAGFAQSFNVDVHNIHGTPTNTFGAAAAQPGTWNAITAATGSFPLVDLAGTATGVTLTVTGLAAPFDFNNAATTGDDQALMDDLADSAPSGGTWTISGLAGGNYILITYAWAPDSGAFRSRVTVAGSSDPAQDVGGSWPGTYALGVTHAVHHVSVAPGGSIAANITVAPAGQFASMNGFQLTRAPELPCTPLTPLGPEAEPLVFCNIVPARWQAQDVPWSGDVAPHNKIDDLLDVATGLEDIVVNFRRPVTAADISFLENLSSPSSVQMVCRYITSVSMVSVSSAEVVQIASQPGVAFIERQPVFEAGLNISVKNIRVASSLDYSPNTVEDAFPGLDGSGINIAIVDTGVDNLVFAQQHPAFAATPFIAGYDAITNNYMDPDDENGHGTHVASIALGQAAGNTSSGVAPGAGLIDIRILGASGGGGSWADLTEGLQVLYDNRVPWNVKVANMSIWAPGVSHDGTESFSQMVDLGESMGIVMVTIAGNGGPSNLGISTPGAATRAITVAASDDMGTVTRVDDAIASYSSKGPRASDGDADAIDEQKPDVTAPGTSITAAAFNTTDPAITRTLSGTSMAAPHVAGLAALILEQGCPGMNPASVKQRLIATATPLPGYPASWNEREGWGLIDGFAAISAGAAPITDLTFPNHPANPSWESLDITTNPFPPQVGQLTTVTAMIRNAGTATAVAARIQFGVHVYSASVPTYHDIGSKILSLPPGITAVSIDWVPEEAAHQCLQVEIGYGQDSVCTNNDAHRNVSVANSPIHFQVRNTLTEAPATIDLSVMCTDGDTTGWSVQLFPSTLVLAGCDLPVEVTALAIPPVTALAGATIKVHVAARIGTELLGGVSFFVSKKDCNGNTVDDYLDIQNGTSVDGNGNGVPDECDRTLAFCFGDGSLGTPCPCANSGVAGHGCENSASTGGALLSASGTPSLGADTLVLTSVGERPTALSIFLQGSVEIAPTNYGDGLRCAGGSLKRLYTRNAVGGAVTAPTGTDPSVSARSAALGHVIPPEATRFYQVYYRDPTASFCPNPPGATFNVSNGVRVIWAP